MTTKTKSGSWKCEQNDTFQKHGSMSLKISHGRPKRKDMFLVRRRWVSMSWRNGWRGFEDLIFRGILGGVGIAFGWIYYALFISTLSWRYVSPGCWGDLLLLWENIGG